MGPCIRGLPGRQEGLGFRAAKTKQGLKSAFFVRLLSTRRRLHQDAYKGYQQQPSLAQSLRIRDDTRGMHALMRMGPARRDGELEIIGQLARRD